MSAENRLMNAVHNVTRVLSATLDLNEAMRRTLEVAIEAVAATGGTIWRHESEDSRLICRHVVGEKAEELEGFAIREDQGIAGRVFQTGVGAIDNEVGTNPGFSPEVDERFHHTTRTLITVPLRYPGGEIVGVVQVVNKHIGGFTEDDMTVLDIIASVSAMSFQNADLARQAKKGALMDYLGRLAHDIKNIDARIIGPVWSLQALLNDALDNLSKEVPLEAAKRMREEVEDMFLIVRRGAEEMHQYTEFMARVAKGDPVPFRPETGDLVEKIRKPLGMLEPIARREQQITIKTDFGPLPEFAFDSFLIERAVYNLVNNALPHVPPGGSITARIFADEDDAVIEISDTGAGMLPNVLQSVLRGIASSTTKGGTGLGTKIVKEVVELHGGTFEGESHLGVGTTFRLRLPMKLS